MWYCIIPKQAAEGLGIPGHVASVATLARVAVGAADTLTRAIERARCLRETYVVGEDGSVLYVEGLGDE